jgi:hypothetical protein
MRVVADRNVGQHGLDVVAVDQRVGESDVRQRACAKIRLGNDVGGKQVVHLPVLRPAGCRGDRPPIWQANRTFGTERRHDVPEASTAVEHQRVRPRVVDQLPVVSKTPGHGTLRALEQSLKHLGIARVQLQRAPAGRQTRYNVVEHRLVEEC